MQNAKCKNVRVIHESPFSFRNKSLLDKKHILCNYRIVIRYFLLHLLWLTSYKCIMETDEIVAKAKKELSEEKDGAVWLAMMELSDYIKFSAIAKNYFNKSSNWILQRLHGYEVNGKPARFKPEEMTVFVRALREISAKLNKCADRLEQAK